MNEHISEELPRLLTGEAERSVVLAAAEHLRICPDCQQELVSAVVAHASLSSAHRFAPEVVVPGRPRRSKVPDEDATALPDSDDHDHDPSRPALPDMSVMFEQIRDEAATAHAAAPDRAGRSSNGNRGRHRILAVAAAVAVVLAGGGYAVDYAVTAHEGPAGQRIALGAFEGGQHSATAVLDGDTLEVNATSLPRLDATQRYEVWLTDPTRTDLQSIGFIGDNNRATLTLPSSAIKQYTDIEVSVQRYDQTAYSGHSVLRGAYS